MRILAVGLALLASPALAEQMTMAVIWTMLFGVVQLCFTGMAEMHLLL